MSMQLTVLEEHFKPLRSQIAEVLSGTSITEKRLVRSVIWAVQDNPALMDCAPASILRFGMTVASLQLEPNPAMGQIFALPFSLGSKGGKRSGAPQAQTVMGYKGYNTIGWRDRITINGNVVREGDHFEFEEGSAGFVTHRRSRTGHWTSHPITFAWATATSPGRDPIICIMDIDEIEFVKARSPGAASGKSPWNDPKIGYDAMAIKTPKRRLARGMPFGAFTQAATMEEAFEERGLHSWIEPKRGVVVEGQVVEPPQPRQPPQSEQERAAIGKPPVFPIYKGKDIRKCATIDEWRSMMEIAINAIRTAQLLEQFRGLNEGIMDELRHEFAAEVKAVGDLFAQRLGELP